MMLQRAGKGVAGEYWVTRQIVKRSKLRCQFAKNLYYVLPASNGNGTMNNSKTFPVPGNRDVRAHVQLAEVTSAAFTWAVTAEITDYVQNGGNVPVTPVTKRLLEGHNITEITFVVNVTNASAVGSILVEIF